MTFGFLLLCGGHSSRMGQNKALLTFGGKPLVMHIADAGKDFEQRILSVNDNAVPTPDGFVRVADVYRDCGPMGGLHAALNSTSCDALVVAPCDAPCYSRELAQYLAASFSDGLDALILRDDHGKAHPLMGVYSKSCLPVLENHLQSSRFKLMRMLDGLCIRELILPEHLSQQVFENLNRPEDVERFLGK